jgi:hypothetical protein
MTIPNDPGFDDASTVTVKTIACQGLWGRRSRYRLRAGLLAAVMVGVWLGILVDPVVGPVVGWILGGLGLTLALLLGAMGLSWLGFGLFALGDWIKGWLKQVSSWPDS